MRRPSLEHDDAFSKAHCHYRCKTDSSVRRWRITSRQAGLRSSVLCVPTLELWRLDDVSLMLHTGDIRKPATLAGVLLVPTGSFTQRVSWARRVYRKRLITMCMSTGRGMCCRQFRPNHLLPASCISVRQAFSAHCWASVRRAFPTKPAHCAVQSVRTHQSCGRMGGATICSQRADVVIVRPEFVYVPATSMCLVCSK